MALVREEGGKLVAIEPKARVLHFRVTDAEGKAIEAEAERRGLTVVNYLRARAIPKGRK